MSRFPIRSSRRVVARRQPIRNMMLDGGGASGNGDRGALQHAAQRTSNPYYSNNFLYRWQEYTRWYMTSWEARKIIDIPVDDALRLPFEITGVDTALSTDLRSAYEAFDLDRQNRRALIQERLYGGCCQTIVIKGEEDESLSDRLSPEHIRRGDLEAFNVVDVSRITRPDYDQNPFSAGYDRADRYIINGVEADVSRLVVFDGSPLINRAAMNILQNFRYNPAGFGESKLAPLYDLLVRVVGTQQAAYHLVNMASVLLVRTSNLMALQATDSPALTKLEEICKQISLYRGAVIDNPNADVQQHAASFGSVPELVMSFAQLLSAASDIPATRFLGQAPGGLNATGESDLQNYYDMIGQEQEAKLTSMQAQINPHFLYNMINHMQWMALRNGQEEIADIYARVLYNSKKIQGKKLFDYNIVLIGFMGAGKSTISAFLRDALSMDVVEMDQVIAEQQGMSISEIFETYGEEYFRNLETQLLIDMQSKQNVIISCGGGVAMRERNVAEMKKNGKVVLLKADPQTILDRVKDSDERPLLNGHKNVEYIADLMEARRAKYEAAADIVVQTDGKSALEICEEMIHKLRSADE